MNRTSSSPSSPDIRSVKTVKPSQLSKVRLKFGVPYSVASWLNSDPRVLLYINCPVSYNAKSKRLGRLLL